MTLNFTGGQIAFEQMIDNFAKTLAKTPITKINDNISGDEDLIDGTTTNIIGAFFRKEDEFTQDKIGLLQNADAILMIKKDVVLKKDDKISYDNETYRVEKITTRRLNGTPFYQVAQCFKVL